MKRILIALIILLTVTAINAPLVLANGKKCHIIVRCTVPEIPGMNVPLIEEESLEVMNETGRKQVNEHQEDESKPEKIIEEEQKQADENQESFYLVKTLYTR